jgi:hypothetical protein
MLVEEKGVWQQLQGTKSPGLVYKGRALCGMVRTLLVLPHFTALRF